MSRFPSEMNHPPPASPTHEMESVSDAENDGEQVNNSKSVLHKMATLYSEQLMSDITLVVGRKEYPAHRLILCVTSDVFWVMLMNREWSEWRESRVVLQETENCAAVFPQFLRYFYTGQLRISLDTVISILSLADKYNVKDLITLTLEYMLKNVAEAARHGQLISWLQYTMTCGHNNDAQAYQNFVKWNIEMVGESPEFLNIDAEVLLYLLQQSDLVVHNEVSLYRLVEKWLVNQRDRILRESSLSNEEQQSHWLSLLSDTLSHIRFPMMCPRQLASLLLSPLTQEHTENFVERMALAMSYQSGQEELHRPSFECTGSEFTPRLYTEDNWGSLLTVDNFHGLPYYDIRTFLFSTRSSFSEKIQMDDCKDKLSEWTVDLYPKGVWFKKSRMILWAKIYDVPEVVLRTVRLSITCRSPPESEDNNMYYDDIKETDLRVKIGILVWGVQNGVEHVCKVLERIHRFSGSQPVLNIDDAIQFDDLNTPLYTPNDTPGTSKSDRTLDQSKHLVGEQRDQLKIQIVVMPLS